MWKNVAPLMIFLISAESNENVPARSSSRLAGFSVHIPYFQEDMINGPSTCLYLKISLRFSCSTNSNWILLSWHWWLMLRCSDLFCFFNCFSSHQRLCRKAWAYFSHFNKTCLKFVGATQFSTKLGHERVRKEQVGGEKTTWELAFCSSR